MAERMPTAGAPTDMGVKPRRSALFLVPFAFLALVAAVVAGTSLVRAASDDAGVYDFLRFNNLNELARRSTAVPRYRAEPSYDYPHNSIRVTPRRRAATPRPARNASHAAVDGLGKNICVRTCDGYHFPAAVLTGDPRFDQMLCQAGCPDAEVKLFTVRDKDDLSSAVSADNSTYGTLVTAFAYQKQRDLTCSCRRTASDKRMSPFKDVTLRPGDAVVFDGGAKIFKGSKTWPYKPDDFVPAEDSKLLSKSVRNQMVDLVEPKNALAARMAKADRKDVRKAKGGALPDLPTNVTVVPMSESAPGQTRVILPSPFAAASMATPAGEVATGDTPAPAASAAKP